MFDSPLQDELGERVFALYFNDGVTASCNAVSFLRLAMDAGIRKTGPGVYK